MNEVKINYEPLTVIVKNITDKKGDIIKKATPFIGVKRDLIYTRYGEQIVSNKELMLIVALCSLNTEDNHQLYVTPKQIYYALTNRLYVDADDNRFMKKTLIPTLENLIAKKTINVIAGVEVGDKIKVNTDLILNVSNLLRVGKETFVAIDRRELHRIMNVNRLEDKSVSREKMLSLFMCIVGSISVHGVGVGLGTIYGDMKDVKGLVCCKTLDTMRNITGLSKTTMPKYMELLEKMKLIYSHRFEDYICFDDEKPRNPRNWYARYQAKAEVINIADLWLKQKDYAIYKRKSTETEATEENIVETLVNVS